MLLENGIRMLKKYGQDYRIVTRKGESTLYYTAIVGNTRIGFFAVYRQPREETPPRKETSAILSWGGKCHFTGRSLTRTIKYYKDLPESEDWPDAFVAEGFEDVPQKVAVLP